jgi:hypothetical protein
MQIAEVIRQLDGEESTESVVEMEPSGIFDDEDFFEAIELLEEVKQEIDDIIKCCVIIPARKERLRKKSIDLQMFIDTFIVNPNEIIEGEVVT